MVEFAPIEKERWVLTEEGSLIAEKGSHEVTVFNMIPADAEGLAISTIQVNKPNDPKPKSFFDSYFFVCRRGWERPERLARCKPSRTNGLP